MKKFIIYTLSFIIGATGNFVFAQENSLQNKTLTLEDCINLTLQNNPEIAAACIAHAGDPQALTSLFATHPPIEERIAKLRSM